MLLPWNFIFLLLFISVKPWTTSDHQLIDRDGFFGGCDNGTAFYHQLQGHFYGTGKLMLDSMWDPLHLGPDFYGLPWICFLIVAVLTILFLTFAMRTTFKVEFNEKQAEENLISAVIADHTPAAERKEKAKLRQKVIEINSELAKMKSSATEPLLQKDCIAYGTSEMAAVEDMQHIKILLEEQKKTVQLEETIKEMECYQASLNSEKTILENRCKILQEKFNVRQNLCQEKDTALQQSQKDVDQHVKEIHNLKQKIQEINEKHEKTQNGLKKQIVFHQNKAQDNWAMACASERELTIKRKEVASLSKKLSELNAQVAGHPEPLSKASSSRCDQHIRPVRKYGTVSKKNPEMADKSTQAESADREGQCRAELVAEQSKVEQLGEKMKAIKENHETLKKEILKLELQNTSFQGKLQKMVELCEQKDQALQQKAAQVDFERCDKERQVKEVLKTHEREIQRICWQYWKAESSYMAEIASLKKSQSKLVKLPSIPEDEQEVYLEKLQVEEKKSQQLEKKVQTLEQDGDALKSEKSLLEDLITALLSELQTMKQLCQQKDQALQQNTVQVELAQRIKDLEMQELAQKISVLEAELEKGQDYKAQIELQHQQAQENLMKASEQALEAERKTIAALQNQLAEVNTELSEFRQTKLMPGYSYEALPLLSDSLEDIPLLSEMEFHGPKISVPSYSTRSQHIRPSQSLPGAVNVQPTRKPRRFSMPSIDTIKHKAASILKLCEKL